MPGVFYKAILTKVDSVRVSVKKFLNCRASMLALGENADGNADQTNI